MFLKILIENILWILLLVVGVTQVIWPLIRRRPLFPLFRRSTALKGEIVELEEQLREEKLEDEAETLRKQLEEKRKAAATPEETKQ